MDSGCNYRGYIGDLCPMGILGEPDLELQDRFAEIDMIQQAAREHISPNNSAADVIHAGNETPRIAPNKGIIHFVAHDMGPVTHEAPRMTNSGPVPYPAEDVDKPLQSRVVTSVETNMLQPQRGFTKMEDTVIVTDNGSEGLGDSSRGWIMAGSQT